MTSGLQPGWAQAEDAAQVRSTRLPDGRRGSVESGNGRAQETSALSRTKPRNRLLNRGVRRGDGSIRDVRDFQQRLSGNCRRAAAGMCADRIEKSLGARGGGRVGPGKRNGQTERGGNKGVGRGRPRRGMQRVVRAMRWCFGNGRSARRDHHSGGHHLHVHGAVMFPVATAAERQRCLVTCGGQCRKRSEREE